MTESKPNTTTTATSTDPKKEEGEEHEVEGNHDLHVTPKKKKKDKKKNKEKDKEPSSAAEAVTINQIESAMAQFGLHTRAKPTKAEKNSHAFWDTQPVPKKGIYTYPPHICLMSSSLLKTSP